MSSASPYAGTAPLLRLAARRDRVLIPVSGLALVALAVGSAKATLDLYPTAGEVTKGLGDLLANPAVAALYGPVSDPDSPDAFAVFKTVMLGAVFLALLCFAVVRRHTRTEEEEGRLELVGAGAVGRRAPLTAAVLLALTGALVTIAVTVAGLIGLGMDATGSLAFGAAWLVAALFATGTTAVAAQLTTTARGCSGIALGVIGVAFLARAIGDTADSSGAQALSWVSPLGWVGKVSAYGQNRFWVLLLGLGFAAACVGVAFALLERRDLGSGLLPARPGPATAAGSLSSPLGLAWRLQRGAVLGWSIAYLVLGAVVGSLAKSVTAMLDDPDLADLLRQLGGDAGSLLDTFFATELKIAGVVATAAGVGTVLRIRSEERAGHAEQVLSTATSRRSWLGAYAALGLGLPTWLMLLVGLAAGGSAQQVDGVPSVWALVWAALSTLPAVWLIVATAMALVGVLPRWSTVAWGVLASAFALGEFGSLLNLPAWVVDLSPYPHLPALPGGSMAWGPVTLMTAVAVVLAGLTFVGFRRRDLTA